MNLISKLLKSLFIPKCKSSNGNLLLPKYVLIFQGSKCNSMLLKMKIFSFCNVNTFHLVIEHFKVVYL